jgi:hypothetical protein
MGNKIKVQGKDSLKLLLNRITEGEHIFWCGPEWLKRCWQADYGSLTLPNETTIEEIRAYCSKNKLNLSVTP